MRPMMVRTLTEAASFVLFSCTAFSISSTQFRYHLLINQSSIYSHDVFRAQCFSMLQRCRNSVGLTTVKSSIFRLDQQRGKKHRTYQSRYAFCLLFQDACPLNVHFQIADIRVKPNKYSGTITNAVVVRADHLATLTKFLSKTSNSFQQSWKDDL